LTLSFSRKPDQTRRGTGVELNGNTLSMKVSWLSLRKDEDQCGLACQLDWQTPEAAISRGRF